jgi:NAD-dependent DNA ligase
VLPRFIEWLSDPHNILLFDTIIGLSQITITLKSKKFDGLPILRDKAIYLTGDFKRGMYRDIVSLLESFSATVVTDFTDKVNCVVIGDMHQNIDGRVVRKARENKIPVFEESQLFKMYSLDEDIKNNLGDE